MMSWENDTVAAISNNISKRFITGKNSGAGLSGEVGQDYVLINFV